MTEGQTSLVQTKSRKNHHLRNTFIFSFLVIGLMGCQKDTSLDADPDRISNENLVENQAGELNRSIGEDSEYLILNNTTLKKQLANGETFKAGSTSANTILKTLAVADSIEAPLTPTLGNLDESLVFGFPFDSIDKEHVFGAVLTKVSEKDDENFGGLKLRGLEALHVKPVVSIDENEQAHFILSVCKSDCANGDPTDPFLELPIVGVNEEAKVILVDLSSLGQALNLAEIRRPQMPPVRFLKTKDSKTVRFDFSKSTLVFDVTTDLIPMLADPNDATAPVTTITARWYLRSASTFDETFEARNATQGVGYFMTERPTSPKIRRFSTKPLASPMGDVPPVKYYIRNVPDAHKAAFKSAFDSWNEVFEDKVGKKLLRYEFIDPNDERSELLVTGDVRFNIVEWDLVNVAPYGGLGPNIANQNTGEVLSANVLIQGPKIIKRYKKWFEASNAASQLVAEGREADAQRLLHAVRKELNATSKSSDRKIKLSIGNFELKPLNGHDCDPLAAVTEFEDIPAGQNFKTYMAGYFNGVVAHELGHNIGLRHNFSGNLGAKNTPQKGGVSHSIMEYLGSSVRHLNTIGSYDKMAVEYGYAGIEPSNRKAFCTDENVPAPYNGYRGSAECSRDDATNDPFGNFERQLNRAVGLFTNAGSGKAPEWTPQDISTSKEFQSAIVGLALYAKTAARTSHTWTQFEQPGRPTSPSKIEDFVLGKFVDYLCSEKPVNIAQAKDSQIARIRTLQNVRVYRFMMFQLLLGTDSFTESELACPTVDDQTEDEAAEEAPEEAPEEEE